MNMALRKIGLTSVKLVCLARNSKNLKLHLAQIPSGEGRMPTWSKKPLIYRKSKINKATLQKTNILQNPTA